MGLGTGRIRRDAFLEKIRAKDAKLADELEGLRRYNPQEFRKRLAILANKEGQSVPVRGRGASASPHPEKEEWDEYLASLTDPKE